MSAALRPLLIALGDSWFAYWPHGDVIDALCDAHGFDAKSVAKAGWSLAEVLNGRPGSDALSTRGGVVLRPPGVPAEPQTQALETQLMKLPVADKLRLRAVLVSVGGNDVAGEPEVLRKLIGHYKTAPGLDTKGIDEIVHQQMRKRYGELIDRITGLCQTHLQRRVPILLHGYDHPVPDGRGALAKRWLKPTLDELHYPPDAAQSVMAQLIDTLNEMQDDLVESTPRFAHVAVLRLVGTLCADADYVEDWQNELHPSIPRGFDRIAAVFARHLASDDSLARAVAATADRARAARARRAKA